MFIITQDIISADEGSPGVGTVGPRTVTDEQEKVLRAIAAGKRPKDVEAVHFKLYDDDGIHYYSGYYVDIEDADEFEPLDCYGMPNAGCTYMTTRGKDGKYTCL